MPRWLRGL